LPPPSSLFCCFLSIRVGIEETDEPVYLGKRNGEKGDFGVFASCGRGRINRRDVASPLQRNQKNRMKLKPSLCKRKTKKKEEWNLCLRMWM